MIIFLVTSFLLILKAKKYFIYLNLNIKNIILYLICLIIYYYYLLN